MRLRILPISNPIRRFHSKIQNRTVKTGFATTGCRILFSDSTKRHSLLMNVLYLPKIIQIPKCRLQIPIQPKTRPCDILLLFPQFSKQLRQRRLKGNTQKQSESFFHQVIYSYSLKINQISIHDIKHELLYHKTVTKLKTSEKIKLQHKATIKLMDRTDAVLIKKVPYEQSYTQCIYSFCDLLLIQIRDIYSICISSVFRVAILDRQSVGNAYFKTSTNRIG